MLFKYFIWCICFKQYLFFKLHVILLNLSHRKDKLIISNFQINQLGFANYTKITAVDGKQLYEKIENASLPVSTILDEKYFKLKQKYVNSKNYARVGCALSHVKALNYIIDHNITSPVLVLEDDFLADSNSIQIIEKALKILPKSWGIFFAGHCHYNMVCDTYPIDTYRICNTKKALIGCTHAYVLNGAAAAKKYYAAANSEDFKLADYVTQDTDMERYIIYPVLFSQYRDIKADVFSGGGFWHKMRNESLSMKVKKLYSK